MSPRVRARRRASQPSPRLRRFAESLWLDEPEWAFPVPTNTSPGTSAGALNQGGINPMTTRQTNSRASGEIADLRALMGINLRVARREALNAAKRADELMQAGEPDGAEKHRELMAIAVKLEELGGES